MQLEWAKELRPVIHLKEFQSHIGAIRIQITESEALRRRAFQSHIGAIRICIALHLLAVCQRNFNPTLVQLES